MTTKTAEIKVPKTTTKTTKTNPMSVLYKKLQKARIALQESGVTKSAFNEDDGYSYVELGDFVPKINEIFDQLGLFAQFTFKEAVNGNSYNAILTIYDIDNPDASIPFETPVIMSNNNKNPIQALGGTHTYLRRYLWMMAMEICAKDEVDRGAKKKPSKLEPANEGPFGKEETVPQAMQTPQVVTQEPVSQPIQSAQSVVQSTPVQAPMQVQQPAMQVSQMQQVVQQPQPVQPTMPVAPSASAQRTPTMDEIENLPIVTVNPNCVAFGVGVPLSKVWECISPETRYLLPNIYQWWIQNGTPQERSVSQYYLNKYMQEKVRS